MARGRGAHRLKGAVRPFVVDDVTPASAPSRPAEPGEDPLREHPTALLDERVRRWLRERDRFERSRTARPEEPSTEPVGSEESSPASSATGDSG